MVLNLKKDQKGLRILVVDDNVINLKALSIVLEKNDYCVVTAENGKEALESVAHTMPDLVLLDVQMPDMDGFEVCRCLKENPETQEIPVIFITATDTVESKLTGFKLGAVDYISRPLQMPEVLARVSSQLMLRQFQLQVEEEKDRLEKILMALPVPYVISIKGTARILEINDKACKILEINKEDAGNYDVRKFYAVEGTRERIGAKINKNGLVSNEEVEFVSATGRKFTVLYSAVPINLQGKDAFFVTFNDISERKEMERALQKAATTDYLTGTLNRRAFSERALAEHQRARRYKTYLCIFMLDIDHFKAINDTFGHDIGDEALKVLVHLIGKDLRASDALGRLGGEEFVLLLPETDLAGAKILAERIRKRIEKHSLDVGGEQRLSMNISGGVAIWEPDQTYDEVLKEVDEYLYEAKQTGRNKIVAAGDGD